MSASIKKRKSKVGYAALPLYIFTLIFVLIPLILLVILSFTKDGAITTANYQSIFDSMYMTIYMDSLKLALTTTVLAIVIGYPFGYFVSRLQSRYKKLILLLIMIPFWTSSLLRLYGWKIIFQANGVLDQLLMKLNITDEPLKLLYNYETVVFGMVYALVPFMILAVYQSTEKIDWHLVEAARDLGASPRKAFWTILFPLTKPGLLSGVILTFVPSMGLYFIADILGGNKVVIIGNLIQTKMSRGRDEAFAAAVAVCLMVATFALLWLYRKITKSKDLEGII